MPEGPELLYFAVYLKNILLNYTITELKSFTDKPVIIPKNINCKIIDINCKGKLLWFVLKGLNGKKYFLHIHYGISGWLTFDKPDKNIKFEFILENNSKTLNLYMEDMRRFSKMSICDETKHNAIINKLGIDIFSKHFTLEKFNEIVKGKNMMLASFILKQDIFCGMGNYIKNEVLYLTHLKVTIKTSQLSENQITLLYNNILFVAYSTLMEMLKSSKIHKLLDNSKKTFMPKKLEIPYEYKIYSREFTIKGEKVIKKKIAGRDTYCVKELC